MSAKVFHIGQRSLGASLTLPESFRILSEAFGFSVDPRKDRIIFDFNRRKRAGVWGWQIAIKIGRLTIYQDWAKGIPFPRRRREAEAWAFEFAKAHGFEALKVAKLARPKARPKLRLVGRHEKEGAAK